MGCMRDGSLCVDVVGYRFHIFRQIYFQFLFYVPTRVRVGIPWYNECFLLKTQFLIKRYQNKVLNL